MARKPPPSAPSPAKSWRVTRRCALSRYWLCNRLHRRRSTALRASFRMPGGSMFSVDRGQFGPNFTFGVATAAYQIEGGQIDGRGPCIWDTFAATPGNVKNADDGRTADDHYHLWPADLDLIRDGGFDAYRFSLAWPRLIPEGRGAVNQTGLDFYDRLIDGMLERGLKPYATLYHWDLPSPLQDMGGWMNRDIAGWFADYAAVVAQNFGDRLHATATINEPWCVSILSHIIGRHAPGYRDL